MQWLQQNWSTIVAISGALYTLFSVINGLVQNPQAKSVLGKIIDGLSFISRAQAPGSIKAPFTMSKSPDAPAPDGSSMRAIVPVLLLATLGMSACAFGQCMLGKLKASAQPIISDVSIALGAPNWEPAVASIGAEVGGDLVDCVVQAVVASRQAKQDAAIAKMGGVRMALAPDPAVEHGRAWLAKHPAKACAPIATEAAGL